MKKWVIVSFSFTARRKDNLLYEPTTETTVSGDEKAREERRLEKHKAEKAKIENSVITGIQLVCALRLAS